MAICQWSLAAILRGAVEKLTDNYAGALLLRQLFAYMFNLLFEFLPGKSYVQNLGFLIRTRRPTAAPDFVDQIDRCSHQALASLFPDTFLQLPGIRFESSAQLKWKKMGLGTDEL
jgi:hypothetical protein